MYQFKHLCLSPNVCVCSISLDTANTRCKQHHTARMVCAEDNGKHSISLNKNDEEKIYHLCNRIRTYDTFPPIPFHLCALDSVNFYLIVHRYYTHTHRHTLCVWHTLLLSFARHSEWLKQYDHLYNSLHGICFTRSHYFFEMSVLFLPAPPFLLALRFISSSMLHFAAYPRYI